MPRRVATPAPSGAPAAPTDAPPARLVRPGLRPAHSTPAMIAALHTLAEPRWSADGAHALYLDSYDGGGTLWAVPVAGGPALRLTSDPPATSAPAYGGGYYAAARDAVVYQAAGGGLYRMPALGGRGHRLPTGEGRAVAPAFAPDGRHVAFVVDDGATSDVAILDLAGDAWPSKIPVPADFVADPVWSPDGRRLAWTEWSVPDMAWDASRVVIFDLRNGERRVVMGEPEVAACQPRWSPDGRTLAFLCDRGGHTSLWRAAGDGADPAPWVAEPYDHAGPTWGSGQATYAWSRDGRRVAYVRAEEGAWRLYLLDVAGGTTRPLGAPGVSYSGLRFAPRGDALLALRQAPDVAFAVVALDARRGTERTLATGAVGGLTGAGFARPESITWRAPDGMEIRGLFYRPIGLASDERPPLLVSLHGGPTGQAMALWLPIVQHFVERGWAVLAPNPRGSSGYGRAYLLAGRGEWGAADMADVLAGVDAVVARGWADGGRVVPWGGSAGGYAALQLPALYPGRFKAAVALYAVTDHFATARTTHRLEAHYTDRLVGPLPAAYPLYRERSPIHRVADIRVPVLLLHGDQDAAVTPGQAEEMAVALRAAGVPVVFQLYPGEGHGWSRAATQRDYLTRMDAFLEDYALLR